MKTNNKPFRVLEGYQIDIALFWKRAEGLTLPEIQDRLCQLFGEDKRISIQGLSDRMKRRAEQVDTDNVLGKEFKSPDGLSDEAILTYLQSQIYLFAYIAASKQNAAETRSNADMLLKIMRAKKDLINAGESDSDKAAKEFLKKIRNVESSNQKELMN